MKVLVPVLVLVLGIAACEENAFFGFVADNPVDPAATNYQGYATVGTVDAVVPQTADAATDYFGVEVTVSAVVGADGYDYQFAATRPADATVDQPTELVETVSMTANGDPTYRFAALPTWLNVGTPFFWRGRARLSGVDGAWTEWRELTHARPTFSAPVAGGSVATTRPTLTWPQMPGAERYEVRLSTTLADLATATMMPTTEPSYTPSSGLTNLATYYRQVRGVTSAADGSRTSPWSAADSFSVVWGAITNQQPTGTTPTETVPTLSWDAVAGAVAYELRLATSSAALATASAVTATEPSYQPGGSVGTWYWQVRAKDNDGQFGLWSNVASFSVTSDVFFDFNNGQVPAGFTMSGNQPWRIDATVGQSGSSLRAGTISHSQSSTVTYAFAVPAGRRVTSVSFYRRVSSESTYDKLRFYVNNTERGSWSGTQAMALQTYSVNIAGGSTITLRWSYSKDGSVSSGSDTAWIDDVRLTVE